MGQPAVRGGNREHVTDDVISGVSFTFILDTINKGMIFTLPFHPNALLFLFCSDVKLHNYPFHV